MNNDIQAVILCINGILRQKIKLKIRQNLKILEKQKIYEKQREFMKIMMSGKPINTC